MEWQRSIARILNWVDESFDRLQYGSKGKRVRRGKLVIIPYLGFGTSNFIFMKGRVVEEKGILPSNAGDDLWDNLANMYRRFQSDEIPWARLRTSYHSVQAETVADNEGFFEMRLDLPTSLSSEVGWQVVNLELLAPSPASGQPVQAQGRVLLIDPQAQYGVISDIDDTILITHATSFLRMGLTMFLNNASRRQTFPGVPHFYQALEQGTRGKPVNPLFYVSSSPWNLYDLLVEFLQIQGIPLGPMISLRDWGITSQEFLPSKHRQHKLSAIRMILDFLPELPFVLIGDNGQEDPQIYREIAQDYPGRILAVYIRDIGEGRKRIDELHRVKEEIEATGSKFLITTETEMMARHAAEQEWIG